MRWLSLLILACSSPEPAPPTSPYVDSCQPDEFAEVDPESEAVDLDTMWTALPEELDVHDVVLPEAPMDDRWQRLTLQLGRLPRPTFRIERTGAACASVIRVPVTGTLRLADDTVLAPLAGSVDWVPDDPTSTSFRLAGDYSSNSTQSDDDAVRELTATTLATLRPDIVGGVSYGGSIFFAGGLDGGEGAFYIRHMAPDGGRFLGPVWQVRWRAAQD